MPIRYFAALLLLFSACAATKWNKPGATRADFATDKQFCNLYSKSANENYTEYRNMVTITLFNQCMDERGWTRE